MLLQEIQKSVSFSSLAWKLSHSEIKNAAYPVALEKVKEWAMFIEHLLWSRVGFPLPVTATIKRNFLLRHGLKGSSWIETGTFRGDTAQYLSHLKGRIITIEPHEGLFARASSRFAKVGNVTVIHGLSEQVFPDLLPTIRGLVTSGWTAIIRMVKRIEVLKRPPSRTSLAISQKYYPLR